MQRSTRVLLSVIAVTALSVPVSSRAAIGALDNVPAATLLTPYFESDLDDPNGPQTRLSVFNASENAELAHVQLWTEWGSPTFGFDVYFGGRDMVEIDLRLVFAGLLPKTGPSLSGNGPHSNTNINFPDCSAAFNELTGVSLPIPDRLSTEQLAFLRNTHTGNPVPELGTNRCMASNHGDAIARGYVTIDTVNRCTLLSPASFGYFFDGGVGIASNRNHLVGSFTLLDRAQGNYPASPMAHIEASGTDPLTSVPFNHTFYGLYVGALASDNREPVGTIWQARVLSSAAFDAGTEVIAWRERGNTAQMLGVPCGALPSAFPLLQTQIAAFDEAENVVILNEPPPPPNPIPDPIPYFPFSSQKVNALEFFPHDSGFVQLNLNAPVPGSPYFDDLLQSFVLVRHSRNGAYGAMTPATWLFGTNNDLFDSTTCNPNVEIFPGVFDCENTNLTPFIGF